MQLVAGGLFVRRHLAVRRAPPAVAADIHFLVERAFAPDFRRVGGQYRADQRLGEEGAQPFRWNAGLESAVQRVADGAVARRRSGQIMGAGAADVVLVLGNIRQMGEVAKTPG